MKDIEKYQMKYLIHYELDISQKAHRSHLLTRNHLYNKIYG